MYRPKSLDGFVGNREAISSLYEAIKNWDKQSKPILLVGPTGVGKNLVLELISEALEYELYEINASERRNKKSLKETVGEALEQSSLWKKGKIVLVDEIDALGRGDRGFTKTMSSMMKGSSFPVVLTANSMDKKVRKMKRKCRVIKMEKVPHQKIFELYKGLAEGIECQESVLRSLARRSGGDLRAGLIDFQVLSSSGSITKEDLEDLDSRNRSVDIRSAIRLIFKTMDSKVAKESLDSVDMRPQDIIWWVERNVASEYQGESLASAFDSLSKADVVLRRIKRNQAWSLLKYYFDHISSGVALSKENPSQGTVNYKKPDRGYFFGRRKYKSAELNSLAEEMAPRLHCSKERFKKDYGFLMKVLKKGQEK